jgi:hypothetical protein
VIKMTETSSRNTRKLAGRFKEAPSSQAARSLGEKWVVGQANPDGLDVPLVATRLQAADRWGAWKARWTFGRMAYSIHPGLYGVGQPDDRSPLLVTANYKLSFDSLRRELAGTNAWILVLDTRGINVWCAAGKGTFGTKELVRQIRAARLERWLSHRELILPQLGATGVTAHEVTRETGFKVVYGPVRAEDLPAFLTAGKTATPAMRQIRFNLLDRLVLTPAEFIFTFKPASIILGIFFLLNVTGFGDFGLYDLAALAGAIVTGCILTPLLLPLLPSRSFSAKGALLGLLWAAGLALLGGWPAGPLAFWFKALAYLLILPSLSGYLALNFTGSTTFTSPSGVNREMKLALPPMLIAVILGILLLLTGNIIRLAL